MGGVEPGIVSQVELDAASTLVNITYKSFAGLVSRRPRLMHLIANTPDARPLPSPPGLKTSGIMLWCGDGKLLLATAEPAVREPIGASWRDAPAQPVSGIKLRMADLPADFSPLYQSNIAWTPRRIAAVYRAGFLTFAASLAAVDGLIPVPIAFSFFVHSHDGILDINTVRLISWGAARGSGHLSNRLRLLASASRLELAGRLLKSVHSRSSPSQRSNRLMTGQRWQSTGNRLRADPRRRPGCLRSRADTETPAFPALRRPIRYGVYRNTLPLLTLFSTR